METDDRVSEGPSMGGGNIQMCELLGIDDKDHQQPPCLRKIGGGVVSINHNSRLLPYSVYTSRGAN